MLSVLKNHIESLPAAQFKQTWDCIEALDDALMAGGDTSIIALEYIRLKHMDQIAQVLAGQSHAIKALQGQVTASRDDAAMAETHRAAMALEYQGLRKKFDRLKKKSKK